MSEFKFVCTVCDKTLLKVAGVSVADFLSMVDKVEVDHVCEQVSA